MDMQPLIRTAQLGLLLGAASAALAADGPATLSAEDQTAAFTAAGAARTRGVWKICAEDPNNTGARIESASDVNGDGLPDAVVAEDGTFCYGFAGIGYAVVSKQASGQWRVMSQGAGIPSFLATRGAQGWPDLEIGGPGFCYAVQRWNGTQYTIHRYEYEGKACSPPQ